MIAVCTNLATPPFGHFDLMVWTEQPFGYREVRFHGRVPQVALFYLGVLVFSQSRGPPTGGVFSASAEGEWPILRHSLRVGSFSSPFSNFYFLVDRWLSGRSKLRHGRETAGLHGKAGTQTPRKTRPYKGLRQGRRELAGSESIEGAEASSKFGGGQAALT